MKRRLIWFIFFYEPLLEFGWAWLRYLDNRRKNKPLTPPWDYWWAMIVYGCIHGHVPLADIEREWRVGTKFAYRGRRHLDPRLVGVDRMRDIDSSYTIVGQCKTERGSYE